MMKDFRRRDVLKATAALAAAASGEAFPGVAIATVVPQRTPDPLPIRGQFAGRGREVDVREFAPRRLTDASCRALHARAEAVSDQLAGAHRIRITGFNTFTGTPSTVVSDDAPSCTGDWMQRAFDHVQSVSAALSPGTARVPQFQPIPHVAETGAGARVVHLRQHYAGIPIFQASLTVRFAPDGRLIDALGTVSSIEEDLPTSPKLTVEEAVLLAARHVATPALAEHAARDGCGDRVIPPSVDLTGFAPKVCATAATSERASVLEPGPFGAEIKAGLVWFDDGRGLVLGWSVLTRFPNNVAMYDTVLEASTGDILYCRQLVKNVVTAWVYRTDPGVGRQLESLPVPLIEITNQYQLRLPLPSDPRPLPTGFPDTWTFGDGTSWRAAAGNSAFAYPDGAANYIIYTTQQGNNFPFPLPADPFGKDQLIMNCFYFMAFMHDFLYYLGFRESDGNSQVSNFGRGGLQQDRVDTNLLTSPSWMPGIGAGYTVVPPDGNLPQMYLYPLKSTGRHPALDGTVVCHEYTHIVTDRLVGGPLSGNTVVAPQSAGMSEGWSDFIPCTLFNTTVVGSWVGDNPKGLRGAPYDSNYPGTFGSLGIGWYGDKYPIGEIWCATLMEIARRTDRSILLQVVVDSLKLAPANPNFLQMRECMRLALDQLVSAGRVTAAEAGPFREGMLTAFARFGMGAQAVSINNGLIDIVPDFIYNSRSFKPPVKVIGVAGVSPDGTAFVNGNDGSLWGNRSGSWTHAAATGFNQRIFTIYRVVSGGADVLAKGEKSGVGRLTLAGSQWTWAGIPLNSGLQIQIIDVVATSHDASVFWWGAINAQRQPIVLQAYQPANGNAWRWVEFGPGPAPGPVVGVSADGMIPVFYIKTAPGNVARLAQAHMTDAGGTGLEDMGAPPAADLSQEIDSSTVGVSDDAQSVLALDHTNRMWSVRKLQGSWSWTPISTPAGVVLNPVLRATSDGLGAFVINSIDSHLWRMSWDGSSTPQWTDLTALAQTSGPVGFLRFDAARDGASAFVVSKDFTLWQARKNSSTWTWTDLGAPN